MQRKTRILYLIGSIQELANEMDEDQSSGFEELSAEEIVKIASNMVLNKDIQYQSVVGEVSRDAVLVEGMTGDFYPLNKEINEEDEV